MRNYIKTLPNITNSNSIIKETFINDINIMITDNMTDYC